MPLVFVHGVSNRRGSEAADDPYNVGVSHRDALFSQYLLASHVPARGQVAIFNPYWGDLGGALAWAGKSVPMTDDGVEALGAEGDARLLSIGASLIPNDATADSLVLSTARAASLSEAIDLLWVSATRTAADPTALAAASRQAVSYAAANPRPVWLAEVSTDAAFLTRLGDELAAYQPSASTATAAQAGPEYESLGFGILDKVREGARHLRDAMVDRAGGVASDKLRPAILPGVTRFLGDVLVYLHQQDSDRAAIAQTVKTALLTANAQRTEKDPFIAVGHSMGGNILYDLLTDPTDTDLAGLKIDTLITAGTQVGLFAELRLFSSSDPNIPSPEHPKAAKPGAVTRWLNAFDYNDLLGYRIEPIIADVQDFCYPTHSLLHAHGSYFTQPSFHQRLTARVYPEAASQ